jgi:hypothetical protein
VIHENSATEAQVNADADARNFVQRIRARFPLESGDTVDMTHTWVEAFADRTSEAVLAKDFRRIVAHTGFFSQAFERGSQTVRGIVEMGYVESLMWDIDVSDRVWAWQYVAPGVRALYEGRWGVPTEPSE